MESSELRSQIVRDGHAYWLAKSGGRGGQAMPGRADLDPLIEIPRLVPNVILFDVQHQPLDFRYRVIGTRVRANLTRDLTGVRMSDVDFQRPPSVIWSHHEWVVENRQPRFIRPPYVGPHREFLFIEAAILPLGLDGRPVAMLLVFVDFLTGP